MLRLTRRRRTVLSDTLAEIANLVTAAVVVGFVLGERTASGMLAIAALGLWGAAVSFSVWIAEDEQ